MRFCVLRSGSSGNCTLVEEEDTRLLIDAGGFSQKGIHSLLSEVGLQAQDLSAIIISHLHRDHLNESTLRICQQNGIPLWINRHNVPVLNTLYSPGYVRDVRICAFDAAEFPVGSLVFTPFGLSHDAQGTTCGFRFHAKEQKERFVVYAADLGHFPDSLLPFFREASAVILEANHDIDLLWSNPCRPHSHKKRVAGNYGHLSNEQSADALLRIYSASKRLPDFTVLGHLSADHNSPDHALRTVAACLEEHDIRVNLVSAYRDRRTEFFTLRAG